MNWIYLILAIGFEVIGTTAMKFSNGFTKLLPSVLMGVFYVLSLGSLNFALKKIDIGVAYAIWSGVGTSLIVIIGIFFFKEPVNTLKIVSVILVVLGVIGLNLSGTSH